MNPLSSKAHSLAQTRQTKHRTNRTENQHERATNRNLAPKFSACADVIQLCHLKVFSRFGLWCNFLNDIYKQQFLLHSDWLKQCQLIPKQRNLTSATLNHIRFGFFYHNIKDNEINLCQHLLTIENTDSDLKVHALHYANELLVRVRLSLQKLLQNRSTCRNNTKCLGKE